MSSPEDVPGYFKSSFARSMAFSSESKSLEPILLTIDSTEKEAEIPSPIVEKPQVIVKPSPRRSVPSIPTYDSIRESFRKPRNTSDAIKFWKMKQDGETNGWTSLGNSSQSSEEEILRLRKECQGLMESNRKLQSERIENGNGTTGSSDELLQTQVDTLQWQLKQAESNRQMYRAVMEQVSKFLEKVHKALESSSKAQSSRVKHRVPRSRSVHTVANGGSHSRGSSPSPSSASVHSSVHSHTVHRANSISQIQDSYSTWRSSRMQVVEESIGPEKLSQEAFRLLRTIQSLLNTREPDLARLSDHEHSSSDNRDSTSMGSCSSLVLNGNCREDTKQSGPATPQLSVGSAEDESGFSSMSSFHEPHHINTDRNELRITSIEEAKRRASFQCDIKIDDKPRFESIVEPPPRPPPHQSPHRTLDRLHYEPPHRENRSSSFQATESFPPLTNPRSFHELGLPLVDPHNLRHRRWSSTPVDNPSHPDSLRVLWV